MKEEHDAELIINSEFHNSNIASQHGRTGIHVLPHVSLNPNKSAHNLKSVLERSDMVESEHNSLASYNSSQPQFKSFRVKPTNWFLNLQRRQMK